MRVAQGRRAGTCLLEAYADGLLTDLEDVRARLAVLAARRERYAQKRAALEDAWADGTWGVESVAADWRRLRTRFRRVWAGDWSVVHDPDKAALLADLDARCSLHIAERKTRYHGRHGPPRTARKARYGGLLTLTVTLNTPPGGQSASFAVTETEDEFQAYRLWYWAQWAAAKAALSAGTSSLSGTPAL